MNLVSYLWGFSAFFLAQCAGLPKKIFYADLETAPSYMLEAGYYKKPTLDKNYYPGSFSTVVTKDLVATNSYAGRPQYAHSFEDDSKEDYTQRNPSVQGNGPSQHPDLSIEEDAKGESTQDNRNINTTKKRGRKHSNRNEDEEEDSPWPFAKGGPSYSSFFPINIGGGGGRLAHRSRNTGGGQNEEGQDDVPYSPSGSATAIANAFSTGKGGVANSRATSFGDPYLAAMFLRSGMGNVKGYKEY